ncbi:MAG: hypothetical protein LC750_11130 [Actinobacteria bacterium]|nr:hypothetical protein [Actinomycetota bacterium]
MIPVHRLLRAFLAVLVLGSLVLIAPAHGDTSAVRAPCDALDTAHCLLPFPNDRFTVTDAATDSGRRINFLPVEMPRNIAGKPIDPTEWNRNDGFSPGSEILTFVPGLDLHQTWGTTALSTGGANDPADHIAAIERYANADAPILIIDATTQQRWPFWSELDNNAGTQDDERLLIVRPAINFTEGHRYLVALRNLKNATGATIPAGPVFAAIRDNDVPEAPAPLDEAGHIKSVIGELAAAEGSSFDASQLYLAWDFTVASRRSLTERVLKIRDDAFKNLGDSILDDGMIQGDAPAFSITKVTDITNDSTKLRQVDGTIRVPNYLNGPPQPLAAVEGVPVQAIPGERFLYGIDGLPMQNPAIPTIDVPFVCTIPKPSTGYDDGAAHATLYGHGLLGSRTEATGSSTQRDRERNLMPCAVEWMGLSEYDIAGAVATLVDPSNMASMMDRCQQGFLNFLYLGRALKHPNGLIASDAFKLNGQPLYKADELFYDGNSQGGIMGGALTALSVDFTRATLGVPGINYSTLLNRSVDWEGPLVNENIDPMSPSDDPEDYLPSYSSALYTSFPDKKEQQVVMALLQMLWDRGEGNGYAAHMTTDPLPNTPAHQVLMHAALGDFQVTNFAAEVEARTIGARVMDSALRPGRHWAIAPYFGLTPFPRDGNNNILPWSGSGFVYWDSGNYTPPNWNRPPLETGGDPHGDPRKDPRGGDQKRAFYLTGLINDVMNGGYYLTCYPGAQGSIPRTPQSSDWCV